MGELYRQLANIYETTFNGNSNVVMSRLAAEFEGLVDTVSANVALVDNGHQASDLLSRLMRMWCSKQWNRWIYACYTDTTHDDWNVQLARERQPQHSHYSIGEARIDRKRVVEGKSGA